MCQQFRLALSTAMLQFWKKKKKTESWRTAWKDSMEEFFVAPRWFTADASTSQISFQDTCLHQSTVQLWPSVVSQLWGLVSFIMDQISTQIFFCHQHYFWSFIGKCMYTVVCCLGFVHWGFLNAYTVCLVQTITMNQYDKLCIATSLRMSVFLLFCSGGKMCCKNVQGVKRILQIPLSYANICLSL